MRILNNNISDGASEALMQEQVDKFLQDQNYYVWNSLGGSGFGEHKKLPKIVLREVRIPVVGRISDHVLLINKRKAVNIECKLGDYNGVIRQAEDHLRWCDYSIICVPADHQYMANHYKTELMNKGIGLWFWFRDYGIFEFIYPKFNIKKDKDLRKKAINRIITINTENNQQSLFK